MEYGLWLDRLPTYAEIRKVLILVLMEYGLWLFLMFRARTSYIVLILVLMEYGLWRPRTYRRW